MSKCKRWVFTSFDLSTLPVFDELLQEYLIFGRETCPDTGRKHLQGFVLFKNRRNLCSVKRWLPGSHFERAKGTLAECANYCKKDGDFTEFGSLPADERKPNCFRDVLLKAECGDIAGIKAEYPGIYLRYKANILSSQQFNREPLDNSCGVWICGPPRIGKDYAVRKFSPLFVKSLNKWWDGYSNQDYVLISDVDQSHCVWLASFLKIWADMYPFTAEIKGGTILIRPKRIIVTSNFTMAECFNGITLDALQARFSVYDFFGKEPTYIERQRPQPNDVVLKELLKSEGMIIQQVPDTTHNEREEEGVVEGSCSTRQRQQQEQVPCVVPSVCEPGCSFWPDSGDEFEPSPKRPK